MPPQSNTPKLPGYTIEPCSDGGAVDDWSRLGLTGKMRFSQTEARYGTLQPKLPILVANPSFSHLLIVELWLSFLYGSYNGEVFVNDF